VKLRSANTVAKAFLRSKIEPVSELENKMKALLTLLKADPAQIESFSVEQIVALCGNGKLSDNSPCSQELREYLQIAKSEALFRYLQGCLLKTFEKSGLVLQDIINEFGRRLDYSVESGLYQGKTNAIGFDGLWADSSGHTIVVEVKTTDAYRINLDTLAGYRDELISAGRITKVSSSLIIVGRQDTGDLEAQVRGSKHAWTTRIISADALAKLVSLKENAELDSVSKIHDLLIPFEYTRLDKIIEIAFSVAEDASSAAELEQTADVEVTQTEIAGGSEISDSRVPYSPTPGNVLGRIREQIVSVLSAKYSPFVKKSRALYWTADKSARAAITISKEYARGNFWYAYHPDWDEFLSEGSVGLFVLGCVGRNEAFALPFEWIHKRVGFLNVTEREPESHFHIHLYPDAAGELFLRLSNGENERIQQFAVSLSARSADESSSPARTRSFQRAGS
jgi:hypothetical protein